MSCSLALAFVSFRNKRCHHTTTAAAAMLTLCDVSGACNPQCNSAMQIFAELKRKGDTSFSNPRSLAEALVKVIPHR
jgi:hypothetical protein